MSTDIKLVVMRFLVLFTAMLAVALGLAALSHSADPPPSVDIATSLGK
jgi:hypothetical protein